MKAEKELVCIHHTDILKGNDYWQDMLERLQHLLPTIACSKRTMTHRSCGRGLRKSK